MLVLVLVMMGSGLSSWSQVEKIDVVVNLGERKLDIVGPRLSPPSLYVQARPEDLRVGRGAGADDGGGIREGLLLFNLFISRCQTRATS